MATLENGTFRISYHVSTGGREVNCDTCGDAGWAYDRRAALMWIGQHKHKEA